MNYDSLNTGWIKRHHLTTRQKQNTPLWMKSTSFFNELTARTVQAEKPCSEIQRPTELVNWTYFDISATPYIKHFITYLNHFIVISKTNCKASRQLVWTPLIVMFALRDAPFSMCLYQAGTYSDFCNKKQWSYLQTVNCDSYRRKETELISVSSQSSRRRLSEQAGLPRSLQKDRNWEAQ